MGSIISSFTGGESSAQKEARRASQAAQIEADKNAKARDIANAEREKKLAKQKSEALIIAQAKTKKRMTGSRNIFTSPLGLEDDTLA